MILEFCPGGNLRHLLLNSRVYPSAEISKYINLASTLTHRQLLEVAEGVARGMVHLSSQKVVSKLPNFENFIKNPYIGYGRLFNLQNLQFNTDFLPVSTHIS